SNTFPLYFNFRPVRDTENLFVLTGLQAQIVDCATCFDLESPLPLVAEVTFVPTEARAVTRVAEVSAAPFAQGVQAALQAIIDATGVTFDTSDMGYAVLAATASGQAISTAALPVLISCQDAAGRPIQCVGTDYFERFTFRSAPTHFGQYQRSNNTFAYDQGRFFSGAAFTGLDELEHDTFDVDTTPPHHAAESVPVGEQDVDIGLGLQSSVDGELEILAEYPTDVAPEAAKPIRTTGPVTMHSTAEGVRVI